MEPFSGINIEIFNSIKIDDIVNDFNDKTIDATEMYYRIVYRLINLFITLSLHVHDICYKISDIPGKTNKRFMMRYKTKIYETIDDARFFIKDYIKNQSNRNFDNNCDHYMRKLREVVSTTKYLLEEYKTDPELSMRDIGGVVVEQKFFEDCEFRLRLLQSEISKLIK